MCYFKHSGKFRGNFSEKHGPWFSLKRTCEKQLVNLQYWVVATQISFDFHPENWGFHDPLWRLHIFQRGWFNHQLEILEIKHQLKTCSPGSPGWPLRKTTLLEALFKGPPQIGKGKSHVTNCPISGCHEFVFLTLYKFYWIWRGWYFFVGKNSRTLLIIPLPGRWLGNQAPNQTYWQCLRLFMGN